MAPNFEDLRKTLYGGYTGRIPIAEIDIAENIKESFLNRPILTPLDEVEFWVKAGYDYVIFPIEMDFTGRGFSQSRVEANEPALLHSIEEAEKFSWPDVNTIDLSSLDALAECLPPEMKIIPKPGGLFYFPSVLMGFEALCLSLYSDPDFVEYVFKNVGQIVVELVSRLVKHPAVGAIWLSSDIAFGTSLMISPEMLRKHVFPWVIKIAELTHEADLPLIFHSDGNLLTVIPDLIEAGINALHPIETQAMDIKAIREKYGTQLCLIGNVDVGEALILGTPADVRREVESLKSYFRDQGGYILGSSNSIPPAVPFENYKALIESR